MKERHCLWNQANPSYLPLENANLKMVAKENLHWCNYSIFVCSEPSRLYVLDVLVAVRFEIRVRGFPNVFWARTTLHQLLCSPNIHFENAWRKKKTLLAKISQVGAFAKYESLESFPTFRGKNTKAVGNHHLVPFSGHTHISLHTIVFLLPKQRQAPQTWTFIARDSGIKNHHILSLLSFVGKKVHLWRGCAKSTMAISK